MKKTIAAAAITVLVMGTGSAYAEEGNVRPAELPGGIAHSPNDTRSVSANNAVSFMQFGGQFAHPLGYQPYYDRANHIVTLRYAGPVATNNSPAGHAVSFMQMGGQFAHPPGYKPYYDRANHIVTLRYTSPVVAPNYAHGVVTNNSNHG